MCERPGQLPLLSGMRFARHLHVMKSHGAGETAPGEDLCRGASLSCGSLNPPDEVREGGVTSLLPGRGLQGPRTEF